MELNLLSWKVLENFSKGKSSRPEAFCKEHVLKDFTEFTEKQLCQSPKLRICSHLPKKALKENLIF